MFDLECAWHDDSFGVKILDFWSSFDFSGNSYEDHHDLHLPHMKLMQFPELATKLPQICYEIHVSYENLEMRCQA